MIERGQPREPRPFIPRDELVPIQAPARTF